jgi:PiT family inorganic phosphate transporter
METLNISLGVVVFLVLLALAFDFMNGFHDAANSIATVVSTGVLKPQHAVAFAAFFNVVAVMVFQLKVATTVGKGTVEPVIVDHIVIFGALVGAICLEPDHLVLRHSVVFLACADGRLWWAPPLPRADLPR